MSNSPPSTADRWIGALAHLGVPLYSAILPAAIWAMSASSPFRRAHARQAFSFQCLFLPLYVVAVAAMAFGDVSPLVLVVMLGIALLIELPNVVRAATGRQPLRLVPFDFLR